MKHTHTLFLLSGLLLSGCKSNINARVIVSSFISYDLVKNVSGDPALVHNVVPWGAELHHYEPSPKEVVAIQNSDLFVYSSAALEPWIASLKDHPNTLNLSANYTLLDYDHAEEEHDEAEHEHDHGSMHFWTDPTTYLQLINVTRDRLSTINPSLSTTYAQNAATYYAAIETLHLSFKTFIENYEHPTIYFAGHNANDAFARRYGLTITSFSANYKPDADITGRELEQLVAEIKTNNIHYLFIEELVSPLIAEEIKRELKKDNYELELLLLHGYHNISKNDAKEGVNYATIFAQNIANITYALTH